MKFNQMGKVRDQGEICVICVRGRMFNEIKELKCKGQILTHYPTGICGPRCRIQGMTKGHAQRSDQREGKATANIVAHVRMPLFHFLVKRAAICLVAALACAPMSPPTENTIGVK